MRRIVVSVQNGLLSEALTQMLHNYGEFEPYRVAVDRKKRTVPACVAWNAEIVLMEASQASCTCLNERLAEVEQIRAAVPDCKIVFLCDENTSPEIAQKLITLKKNREIDAFYYSSVTGKYLVAALYAL